MSVGSAMGDVSFPNHFQPVCPKSSMKKDLFKLPLAQQL
jgi:hypothetical protein